MDGIQKCRIASRRSGKLLVKKTAKKLINNIDYTLWEVIKFQSLSFQARQEFIFILSALQGELG